ncbi:hypothetical protein GGR79_002191 [Xanthomonas arboricola]|uniref:hypothetical protein n=1 Tax=Xanthomonas arboricola TaxID=56448 RepID=UPI000C8621AB|nr:hypothetical protein [Xanthomonas arboricola]NJC30724.1 hypothetical protein [Xanthomonas arboricola]PPT61265.1 hypothetical protein XarbCFBP8153_02905 [Xanthomonas arboricola]PPT66491.1 hypothetical protein XarbCFBP8130_00960 [Xanthomonas arboricola]PPT71539.1 hypothetical protein XarbCFBP8150_08260 [Xanthomonas arboricola]
MKEACPHLQALCAQALQAGCTVRDVSGDWSRARRVLEFAQPLPASLRKQARRNAELVHYHAPAAPHWPGDEGFFCDQCRVGLAFPLH